MEWFLFLAFVHTKNKIPKCKQQSTHVVKMRVMDFVADRLLRNNDKSNNTKQLVPGFKNEVEGNDGDGGDILDGKLERKIYFLFLSLRTQAYFRILARF